MIFLYTNMCIIYNFHKCLNSLIIFSMFKFSFHCFFNIKNNLISFIIINVFIFKGSLFVFINIFSIFFCFRIRFAFFFQKVFNFF